MLTAPAALVHAPPMAFRAARNYVHSTDLYPAVLDGARTLGLGVVDGPVRLTMRRLITAQPELRYGVKVGEGEREPDAAGDFSLGIGLRQVDGVILPTDLPVAARKPYDETPIWEAARIEGRRIALASEIPGAAPIEIVTALAVLLHNRCLPPQEGEKWLLASLELVRPLAPDDGARIELAIERQLGTAVTRTCIRRAGAMLGAMAFARRRVGR